MPKTFKPGDQTYLPVTVEAITNDLLICSIGPRMHNLCICRKDFEKIAVPPDFTITTIKKS